VEPDLRLDLKALTLFREYLIRYRMSIVWKNTMGRINWRGSLLKRKKGREKLST